MDNKEIDRLVAEKVMGWRKETYFPPTELADSYDVWVKSETEYDYVERFNPSTNIRDAWFVAEKFEYAQVVKDGGHFYAEVANERYWMGDFENAPMAICLAALKSVGVSVDDH